MAAANNIEINLALKGLAQVEAGIQRLNAGFTNLRNATVGVGTAMLAFSGLSHITGSIEKVAQLGTELANLRDRTGATIPQLIAIRRALKETGVGADEAAGVIGKMQKALSTAAYEGGGAEKSFVQLGLSVQDLLQKSPAEQLQIIGERIGRVQDPALRAAYALDIFGRSGTQLLALFRNGQAMEELARGAGTFGTVMERNADALHTLENLIGRVKGSGQKFWAGFLDMLPLDKINAAINDALTRLDLTKAGQMFGAYVGVAIEQFQAGHLDRFVSLTIAAGFELGIDAAKKAWDWLLHWLSTYTPRAIAYGLIAAADELTKAMAKGLLYLNAATDAFATKASDSLRYAFEWLFNHLKQGFVVVVNWMLEKLETAVNFYVQKVGKLLGMDSQGVSLGRLDTPDTTSIKDAVTWAGAWEEALGRSKPLMAGVSNFFDQGTAAARQLLGIDQAITGEANAQGTAWERLKRLVSDYAMRREQAAAAQKEGQQTSGNAQAGPVNWKQVITRQEFELKERLLGLERMRFAFENDISRTQVEKWQAKKGILAMERQALEDQVKFYREKLALQNLDTDTQNELRSKRDAAQGKLDANGRELGGMGADPASLTDQMTVAFTGILDQVGTVAQQIGRTFTSVIGSAIDGLAGGIYGLLSLTMTWGEALRNIGSSILQGVMSAISRMFAEWLVKRALIFAKELIFAKAEAVAKAPAAAATSISSYGTAAIVGTIAAIAAIGAITAAFMGAFKEGGYTGSGHPDAVAGVVHKGEFVMPADATSRIGLPALEAMRAGQASPVTPATGRLAVAVFDDRSRMKEWLQSNEGKSTVLNLVGQNRHEFI